MVLFSSLLSKKNCWIKKIKTLIFVNLVLAYFFSLTNNVCCIPLCFGFFTLNLHLFILQSNRDTFTWNGYEGSMAYNAVLLPIIDSLRHRPHFLPLAFPENFAHDLIKYHSNPPVFFISQVILLIRFAVIKLSSYNHFII